VEIVHEDLRPSAILTREAFLNAVRLNSALGGSTNAQPHLAAMASAAGVELLAQDWQVHGYDIPLLADVQPAGRFLGERFHRAGGVPAVMYELLSAGKLDGTCATITGQTVAQNLEGRIPTDHEVIRPYAKPLKDCAGFQVLSGNLFDFAIMKTSVISDEFRARYLSTPGQEGCFEGRAVVFDGAEDYHARINDPALMIDERSILVIRGAGPIGWPGSAEVVNMQPPDALIRQGIHSLPTIGDGRQSGTSASPSIVHASPESAVGGGLSWLKTGDMIRIDLSAGRCDALVEQSEITRRRAAGPPKVPESHTPWQRIYRREVRPLSEGAGLASAEGLRFLATELPRHNH
jgi:dihydroxyacid dehydratase/phosphogluconate dehydratase